MPSNFTNHAYLRGSPLKAKGWGLKSFWVGEGLAVWGERCALEEDVEGLYPLFIPCFVHLFHLAVLELQPFKVHR